MIAKEVLITLRFEVDTKAGQFILFAECGDVYRDYLTDINGFMFLLSTIRVE